MAAMILLPVKVHSLVPLRRYDCTSYSTSSTVHSTLVGLFLARKKRFVQNDVVQVGFYCVDGLAIFKLRPTAYSKKYVPSTGRKPLKCTKHISADQKSEASIKKHSAHDTVR